MKGEINTRRFGAFSFGLICARLLRGWGAASGSETAGGVTVAAKGRGCREWGGCEGEGVREDHSSAPPPKLRLEERERLDGSEEPEPRCDDGECPRHDPLAPVIVGKSTQGSARQIVAAVRAERCAEDGAHAAVAVASPDVAVSHVSVGTLPSVATSIR